MATNERRRARRIAADEAHSWARNLRLGNHHGKNVLKALTLYVDGDGYCFVAISTLAWDVELSDDTVRRRLQWLEEIGAIARYAQWIDERGVRNGDGRGKRTSDNIRLMFDADQGAIEARAAGQLETVSREVSPSSQRGLTPEAETVSPALALRQPSHCGEGLISEPEPESPLKAPQGAERDAESDLDAKEPEDFDPAWRSWRGHEVMRRDLALAEFRQLPPDKQRLCRAAVLAFNEMQLKFKRSTTPSFHRWIRQGGFEEFPDARLPEAAPERRWIEGDELAGMAIAARMASRPPLRLADHPELGKVLPTTRPLQADLAVMARFRDEDPATWLIVDRGTPQFAAWRDRLSLWLGGEIPAERIWLEDWDQGVHGVPPLHPNFRLRKSKQALRVPAPWPPHRDGTWPPEEQGA